MAGWKLAGTNIGSDTQFTSENDINALRGSKWRFATDKAPVAGEALPPGPATPKDDRFDLSTDLKYSKDQLELMQRDHLAQIASSKGIVNPKQPKEKLIEFILEKQS